jgi:hypothetical protein
MKHERLCNLADVSPLVGQYLAELRDVHLQQDRSRFRHNIRRIAWLGGNVCLKLFLMRFYFVLELTPS